eukprot:gene10010-11033_t
MLRASKSKDLDTEYSCKIRLLDDSEISCDFKKDAKGDIIFAHACEQINVFERDFFGLRFVDSNKQRHWLELNRDLFRQLKHTKQPYMFFFRVRFYPTDPSKLQEEITRYQLFLQLKRDILHGRLLCPFSDITELAALVVQAEAGDFDEEEHKGNYVSEIKLLPRQTEKLEDKITEIHKSLSGLVPVIAESRFLDKAKTMDLYGVDPHPCRDQDDAQLYLGLTPVGIQVIRDAKRVSGFPWTEIHKVTYESKSFYIQIVKEKKKTNYSFRLNDMPACKHLWKCTQEQMAFYGGDPLKSHSVRKSTLSPQNIFKRKKYTYSGKTEFQLSQERDKINRPQPNFERTPSIRMVSAKKPSNLPSRHSLALDDRASQVFTSSSEQGNRSSSVSGSGSEEDKPEANDNNMRQDQLREFETNEEFPPEPPLDASRTSLVSHEDVSDYDRKEATQEKPAPMENPNEIEPSKEEKSAHVLKRNVLLDNQFVLFSLVGLLILVIAILLELKYNLIRKI